MLVKSNFQAIHKTTIKLLRTMSSNQPNQQSNSNNEYLSHVIAQLLQQQAGQGQGNAVSNNGGHLPNVQQQQQHQPTAPPIQGQGPLNVNALLSLLQQNQGNGNGNNFPTQHDPHRYANPQPPALSVNTFQQAYQPPPQAQAQATEDALSQQILNSVQKLAAINQSFAAAASQAFNRQSQAPPTGGLFGQSQVRYMILI
jgi:hypothetical protein